MEKKTPFVTELETYIAEVIPTIESKTDGGAEDMMEIAQFYQAVKSVDERHKWRTGVLRKKDPWLEPDGLNMCNSYFMERRDPEKPCGADLFRGHRFTYQTLLRLARRKVAEVSRSYGLNVTGRIESC
ncbi:hypothetical protein H6784_05180 [Candidatus Nomurabacteria bacterium]|nr:hypothetical protein [Candidatus Nomurabacteria bacterium]